MQKDAVRYCSGGRHAKGLTGQATFSKEIGFAQNAESCFFPAFRYNAEPYLALLDEEQSVRRLALREDRILPLKRHHVPTLPNG